MFFKKKKEKMVVEVNLDINKIIDELTKELEEKINKTADEIAETLITEYGNSKIIQDKDSITLIVKK